MFRYLKAWLASVSHRRTDGRPADRHSVSKRRALTMSCTRAGKNNETSEFAKCKMYSDRHMTTTTTTTTATTLYCTKKHTKYVHVLGLEGHMHDTNTSPKTNCATTIEENIYRSKVTDNTTTNQCGRAVILHKATLYVILYVATCRISSRNWPCWLLSWKQSEILTAINET